MNAREIKKRFYRIFLLLNIEYNGFAESNYLQVIFKLLFRGGIDMSTKERGKIKCI